MGASKATYDECEEALNRYVPTENRATALFDYFVKEGKPKEGNPARDE